MIDSAGSNLVFLVGQPRSGTTLLSLLLAGHSKVFAPSELWIGLHATRLLHQMPSIRAAGADEVLTQIAIDDALTRTAQEELVREYLVGAYGRILEAQPDRSILVDKTPRYYRILPTLAALLPEARFILLSRNPLDVAASHKTRWGVDLCSLASPAGLSDASYDLYCAPELIADARDQLPARRCTWLRYEDLVANPDDVVTELCRFLGIEHEHGMQDPRGDGPSHRIQRASLLGDKQVWERDGIDASSVGIWQAALTPEEVTLTSALIGPLTLERLGFRSPRPELDDEAGRELLRSSLVARLCGAGNLSGPDELRAEISILRTNLWKLVRNPPSSMPGRTPRDIPRDIERAGFQGTISELESQRAALATRVATLKSRVGELETQLHGSRRDLERVRLVWPWIEATRDFDPTLPRISIVTPSLNQGRWIEETIQSVLGQNYPNFEHIVVDGGSTDETTEVVARYPHVRFVIERDLGQAHAINKGILKASGEIIAYLNSDDLYRPGAFYKVARALADPHGPKVVVGACDYIDAAGATLSVLRPRYEQLGDLHRYWGWERWYCIPQQAVFWRREILSQVGLFDISHQYTMDYEMWVRMFAVYPPVLLEEELAAFREQPDNKTVAQADRLYRDHWVAARKHWPAWWRPRRLHLELASRRYTAHKLVDVAEHEALSNRRRKRPSGLVLEALSWWPLLAMQPRTWLTLFSAAAARSPLEKSAAFLHRGYLSCRWRLRRPIG